MCVPNFMFKLSTFIKEGGFYSLPSAWHSDEVTSIKMSRKGVLNTQNILFNFRMSGEKYIVYHKSTDLLLQNRS